MSPTATAQLYVLADADRAERALVAALAAPVRVAGLHIEAPAAPRVAGWAVGITARRRVGRWRRGRFQGRLVLDLIPVGHRRTLLTVELGRPERWARPPTPGEAAAVAARLRRSVESGSHRARARRPASAPVDQPGPVPAPRVRPGARLAARGALP